MRSRYDKYAGSEMEQVKEKLLRSDYVHTQLCDMNLLKTYVNQPEKHKPDRISPQIYHHKFKTYDYRGDHC